MNVITASDRIDHIGYETENGRTQVRFDLSDFMAEFPGGYAVLTIKRPGERRSMIPVITEMQDSFLFWTVSAYELEHRGILEAQVAYLVNDVVAKTDVYKFMIADSLDDNSEPVPEGWVEWVNHLLSAASEVNGEVQSAQETLNNIRNALPREIESAISVAVETVLRSEQDPTVPSWAKRPVKPSYTAAEVGALPENTFIPKKTSDLVNDDQFYSKPANGIPASDIAEGVIPDISEKLDKTEKGVPGGIASLGSDGKVPDSQLPAYVDDVKEYSTRSQLPGIGQSGVIYIITTTSKIYYWYGGTYIELGSLSDLSEVIDDTAGAGATNRTWSANKLISYFAEKANQVNPTFTGSISKGRKANTTVGAGSSAIGWDVESSGLYSFGEGYNTSAKGNYSHSEGLNATAQGSASHAEGQRAQATGDASHAENYFTKASGRYSHAEGYYTEAKGSYQHVSGKANVIDNDNQYAEIVGNGTSIIDRSNARTLDWAGNESLAGGLTLGKGTADEVTITAAQLAQLLALLN